MSLKARTPIVERDDSYAIELGSGQAPQERDRLTDQAMVIAYDIISSKPLRWRLRAIFFDRGHWTRSGARRWWAAHQIRLLGHDELETAVPEVCRAYEAPSHSLPAILLCHRNTPMRSARQQISELGPSLQRNPSQLRHPNT